EEAYEVVEAVEALPPDAPAGDVPEAAYRELEDELGDLLYQVIFHAVLAEEAGAFDMADVARGIHDKLVRRHPHVFGNIDAETRTSRPGWATCWRRRSCSPGRAASTPSRPFAVGRYGFVVDSRRWNAWPRRGSWSCRRSHRRRWRRSGSSREERHEPRDALH